tara:strand:- start:774 stop:1208 length:435 start_codon:yes stop_codon:yes gene_type:complete
MKRIILKKIEPAHDQCHFIHKIYMDLSFENGTNIINSIKKKINGYKQQDVKKNRLNNDDFITYDDLIEKLLLSKLICFYCKHKTLISYEEKRDPRQWTLDRIDNSLGHNKNNVLISCLKCNLERRTRDSNKFKFAKQMKIIKKE